MVNSWPPSRLPFPVLGEDVPKVVIEYQLPAAMYTNEVVAVGDDLLVISQQSSSTLVKVNLDEEGKPVSASRHPIGTCSSGLLGLFASVKYPGSVWATISFENAILRIDCNSQPPTVVMPRIELSLDQVWGPHLVVEDEDDLWCTFKGSSHVVRINHTRPSDYNVYQCSSRPIFVAIHPSSNDVYASLDQSSKIFRLNRSSGKEPIDTEIDLPSEKGTLPMGLVAAPDGNVWFVMLGGCGTFGRISKSGHITWFTLASAAGRAGLIHLAFHSEDDRPFFQNSSRASPLCCYLLSCSSNAVIRVLIGGDPLKIMSEATILVPTSSSKTHRVLSHGRGWNGRGLFITEMRTSMLAHVTGSALSERTSETDDDYSLWGWGVADNSVVYED